MKTTKSIALKALIVLPVLLNAESFSQISSEISNSLRLKAAKEKIKIYEEKLKSVKAKNYGNIKLNYTAVHFFKQPEMKLSVTQPVAVASDGVHLIYQTFDTELPVSDKNHFIASAVYSYPIFTGYALSSLIKKSELELIKQKLLYKNLKREFLLKAAELYSSIYSLKHQVLALNSAKEALLSAKEKAEALYNEGLINRSELEEINAKYYEVVADIKNINSQKNSLLETLSYLINKKISRIEGVDSLEKKVFDADLLNRSDVKAVRESLEIANTDIKLAKSKYYPSVGLQIGIKREADDILLTDNDYQNVDHSFAGISIEYTVFDGGERSADLQMAKIAKNTYRIFYEDYVNKVKTEFQSDLNTYNALFFRLKAAQEEVKARESYYEYIKAKFNEGLSDSSTLNEAIAKLAQTRAKKEAIKSKIFFLEYKLKLNSGM